MDNRFYFSNIPDENSWSSNDNNEMRMILLPKKWWSIKEWKLAKDLMKELRITSMTTKKEKKK